MTDLTDLLDYLAAAIADRMREVSAPLIDSPKAIQEIFGSIYKIELSDLWAGMTAHRLEQLSLLRIVVDQYAGRYLIPKTSISAMMQLDNISRLRPSSTFVQAVSGGKGLLARVFSNEQFWGDLSGSIERAEKAVNGREVEPVDVPASDRVVTLAHNQRLELEAAATDVVDALSKENAIDGNSDLRDQMLGQLRAGRELIRAQAIRVWLLEQTVVGVLNSLIQRFGEKFVGAVAKRLLDLLMDHVFGK